MSAENHRSMSATVRDATKFVGQKTIAEMKLTRWYAFARILEDLLYYRSFDSNVLPGRVENVSIAGIDERGNVVDLKKALRDLAHDCEEQALLEVTS